MDASNHRVRFLGAATGTVSSIFAPGFVDGSANTAGIVSPVGAVFANGALLITAGYGTINGNKVRSATCGLCPGGYLCALGFNSAATVTACPGGTFASPGARVCTVCPEGTYAPAASSACLACPSGAYCELGSLTPYLCPAGMWSAAVNATSFSTCAPCDLSSPGYGCAAGATSPTPTLCAVGYFCGGGAAGQVACAPSTACPVAGLSSQPACMWNVSTLTGQGIVGGFSDGVGTAAIWRSPSRVVIASNGADYIALDTSNQRVRVLSASGVVTTLAGGLAGTTGGWVDAQGTNAQFNSPAGLAVIPGGDIVVTESVSHRIRRVTMAGVVTTLAGTGVAGGTNGVGTSASFQTPSSVVVTSNGTLVVTDFTGHRLRLVSVAGRLVTTLAGSGIAGGVDGVGDQAAFNGPIGSAIDQYDSVIVADLTGQLIRNVSLSGVVTTIAGCYTKSFSYDGQGTNGCFFGPRGVAVDSSGNVFVAEGSSSAVANKIRVINRDGVVSTVAGRGSPNAWVDGYGINAYFDTPTGIAITAAGALVIGDMGNFRLRFASCSPCPTGFFCNDNVINCPAGSYCPIGSQMPTGCPAGYFSGVLNAATNAVCTGVCTAGTYCPGGTAAPLPCPAGSYSSSSYASSCTPCSSPPGYACAAGSTVSSGSLCPVGSFCAGQAEPARACDCPFLCATAGLAAETGVAAWYVDTLAGSPAGLSGTIDGSFGSAYFNMPTGISVGADGTNIWVSEYMSNRIRVLALSAQNVTTVAGNSSVFADIDGIADVSGSLNRPWHIIATDSIVANTALFIEKYAHRVRSVDLQTKMLTTLVGNGTIASFADGIGTNALLNQPGGPSLSSAGVLYFADAGGHRIRSYTIATGVVSSFGSGNPAWLDGPSAIASFWSPAAVTLSSNETVLFCADTSNYRIRASTLQTWSWSGSAWVGNTPWTSTLAGAGVPGWVDGPGAQAKFNSLTGLALSPSKKYLWVLESMRVRVVDIANGVVSTLAGSGVSGLSSGYGTLASFRSLYAIAVTNSSAYFADGSAHNIRRMVCRSCPVGSYCTVNQTAIPCPPGYYGSSLGLSTDQCSGPCTALPGYACQGGSTSPAGTICPRFFSCAGGAALPVPCQCALNCAMEGTAGPEPAFFWTQSTLSGNTTAGFMNGFSPTWWSPYGVAASKVDGGIYVASDIPGNIRCVRRINPGGEVVTVAGFCVTDPVNGQIVGQATTEATIGRVLGVAVNPSSNQVYMSDFNTGLIRVLSQNGTYLDRFPNIVGNAFQVIVTPDSNTLLLSTYTGNRVYFISTTNPALSMSLFNGAGAHVDSITGTTASIWTSTGLALNPSGTVLYVGEFSGAASVRAINLNIVSGYFCSGCPVWTVAGGVVAGFLDGFGTNARFTTIVGLAVDIAGNIFVSENGANRIRFITPSGLVTTLFSGSGNTDGAWNYALVGNVAGLTFNGTSLIYASSNYNVLKSASCTLCPQGSYCNWVSSARPVYSLCPMNSYCPTGSWSPKPCPSGYYSFSGSISLSECVVCPLGFYCPPASFPRVCPAGTYGDVAGQFTNSSCAGPCTAAPGFGCAAGSTSPGGSLCNPGFFCPGGAAPPTACACPGSCSTSGNVFDAFNSTAGTVWNVTRVAGTGAGGSLDGPLLSATFNTLRAIAFSSNSSQAYVTDNANRIRVIPLGGPVTSTLAGGTTGAGDGQGVDAMFQGLFSAAIDPLTGSVWLGDQTRIRHMTTNGTVTTLPGCASGGVNCLNAFPLANVFGIALYPSVTATLTAADFRAALIVADNARCVIRLYTRFSSIIVGGVFNGCVFADGPLGVGSFVNPRGVALDPLGTGTIYVADYLGCRIRAIYQNGTHVTVAGNGGCATTNGPRDFAQFFNPEMIVVDTSGAIYVSEVLGHAIRRIAPDGYVSTIAGQLGTAGNKAGFGWFALFNQPFYMAQTPSGALLVSESQSNVVKSLTCDLCPGGFYCVSAYSQPVDCQPNYYCPRGSSAPLLCELRLQPWRPAHETK